MVYKAIFNYLNRKNKYFCTPMTTNTDLQDIEEQDFYEHLRVIVDKGQSLLRIDKFLMYRVENASRNRTQNAIDLGNVMVNDTTIKAS